MSSPPTRTESLPPAYLQADTIRSIAGFKKADFGTKALFASAAAWSPNPANPPFYLDLPIKDGVIQSDVLKKWEANRPLNTLDQNVFNIRMLHAVGFDAGTSDKGIAASITVLNDELNKYGIAHFFELYDGNHIDHVAERIETTMLGFFGYNLSFKQTPAVKKMKTKE
jgi:hypothetical protein